MQWKHLAGQFDERAAEILLEGLPHGTYLLRKTPSTGGNGGGGNGNGGGDDDESSYALSYVATSGMGTDNPGKPAGPGGGAGETMSEVFVVHALLRCRPGRFDFCGVARGHPPPGGRQQGAGDVVAAQRHDPKLVTP